MTRFIDIISEKVAKAVDNDGGLRKFSRTSGIPIGKVRSLIAKNDLKVSTMLQAANYFNMHFDLIDSLRCLPEPDGPEIEWHGEIAAGGSEDPNDCRLYLADEFTGETVSPPPALTADQAHKHGGLFAVTVRGDSMTPTYRDGDTIYMYKNDPARLDLSRLIGQDCAVTMAPEHDSAVFLKRLRWPDNQQQGYFNLESLNPRWPTMPNIQLHSALPVRYVKRNI